MEQSVRFTNTTTIITTPPSPSQHIYTTTTPIKDYRVTKYYIIQLNRKPRRRIGHARQKSFDQNSSIVVPTLFLAPAINHPEASTRLVGRGCKYEEVINVSRHRLIISCQRIFEDHSGRGRGRGIQWACYGGRAQTRDPNRSRINTSDQRFNIFPLTKYVSRAVASFLMIFRLDPDGEKLPRPATFFYIYIWLYIYMYI